MTVFLALSATVHAETVWHSAWNSTTTDPGAYSQASQLLAGEFNLNTSVGVNRATWQGTFNNLDPSDVPATWTFSVKFWYDDGQTPGMLLTQHAVVATVTDSGSTTPPLNGPISYLFDATFPDVSLAASTDYWFTVENTYTPDTFTWTEAMGSDLLAAGQLEGFAWTPLLAPSDRPLNFRLFAENDVPASISSVPEPTSFGLLSLGAFGLAACAWRRRRRLAASR